MMETSIAIQEKDLELVVSEKTLGHLVTNAKEIRDMVKLALPKYDISNYNDDNIAQAKKDKATLNKASKALNSKRIEIEREFMKPFGEFKEIVSETVSLIGECSSRIDSVVKQNEQRYKDNKLKDIRTYFDGTNLNHVNFDKVFKQEWLNKTSTIKSVCAEIDVIQSKINSEIDSLRCFNEDFDVLLTYYMDTLNIGSTLQYANRLKEQRERVKRAEEEKRKAEEAKSNAKANALKEAGERILNQKEESRAVSALKDSVNDTPIESSVPVFKKDAPEAKVLHVRAFKVTATKEQIIALGDYMNENGIEFEKIEL